MSRAGRKRKTGTRHACGQLKRLSTEEREASDRVATSRQPHRRALAHQMRAAGADDVDVRKLTAGEEAESPIGRMWAAGLLKQTGDPDGQPARDRYDAGTMFAQTVGAYRSVIEAPRDVAGSGRGFPCQELLCALARENCECEHRKERYDRAYEALQTIGRRALMAVNAVAVHRQEIEASELVYLVAGLDGLRRVFGLTGKPGRKQYRNAN